LEEINMLAILEQYYQFFNAGNYAGMLGLLSDEVMHEPCQGSVRHGKEKFAEFLRHMERCYKEQVHNPVFMVSADGKYAAVEFFLTGIYLVTDTELPPAQGQQYQLRVGTFFEINAQQITRVSNHYNLQDWINQIST